MKHYYICTLCILHLRRNCRDFVAAAGQCRHLLYLFLFRRGPGVLRFCIFIHRRVRATFMTVLCAFLHKGAPSNCFYRSRALRVRHDKQGTKTPFLLQREPISFLLVPFYNYFLLLFYFAAALRDTEIMNCVQSVSEYRTLLDSDFFLNGVSRLDFPLLHYLYSDST